MPEPDFAKRGGLIVAVAQDAANGQVLMVAYMNREAWQRTLETGRATYWSTSRGALWTKGETSGHVQRVHEVYRSCFFRRVEGDTWRIVGERPSAPVRR